MPSTIDGQSSQGLPKFLLYSLSGLGGVHFRFSGSYMLPRIFLNEPLSFASSTDVFIEKYLMNSETCAANSWPSSLPYLMPKEYMTSAKAMKPKPILLTSMAASFISGTAGIYLLASTTLSKKRVAETTLFLSSSQSSFPSKVKCSARFIEPRQQFSYGPSHCSPQGLVASNYYKWG